MLPWVGFTAVAVVGLLAAELRSSRAGIWIAKPLASTSFVAAALSGGALETTYGRIVLAALALSWLGDVLLIPTSPAVFRAGIASFFLAHLAFAGAFAIRGLDPLWTTVGLLAAGSGSAIAAAWLRSHLPADFEVPVFAYLAVITVMVAFATGTWPQAREPTIVAGALAFYLSDLSVARDRFVSESFANRLWGLPLYYAAQLLFATSARR